MFTQIGVFLVDAVASFFVFMLLARFHFQWLRVPFRNPVGEFALRGKAVERREIRCGGDGGHKLSRNG